MRFTGGTRIKTLAFILCLIGGLALAQDFSIFQRSALIGAQAGPAAAGGGGGGPTSLFTDNFNIANNASLVAGWTNVTGESFWLVRTNAAAPGSYSSDATDYVTNVVPNANQYARGKIYCTSTSGGGQGPGLAVRVATGARTYYRVIIDAAGSSNVELGKMVAGSYTTLWTRTVAFSSGATMELQASNTTLRVIYAGTQIGADTTDSSIASGRFGISYSSVASDGAVDDFDGGNL